MILSDYGIPPETAEFPNGAILARVTAVHKERFEAVCDRGVVYARLKSAVYFNDQPVEFPTVGDYVQLLYNGQGDSLITGTLPRRSFFSRRDPTPGRGEQAVAANFDTVFLLQSLNRDFNLPRLERYLASAWQSGALPVVLLTKADLCENPAEYLLAVTQAAPGVDVYAVSAVTGEGLDALAPYLPTGKTVVFLGSSGVGKSSLVNALAGGDLMPVGDIREDDSRGRHTTTHRQLLRLPGGALVIDTPGMRMLGLWDTESGLSDTFGDIEALTGRCRFSDCTHGGEPGCAVREALDSGALQEKRWQSYCKLEREARYSSHKEEARRAKQQWHKTLAKDIRRMQKEKRRFGDD